MRKLLALLLAMLLMVSLVACGGNGDDSSSAPNVPENSEPVSSDESTTTSAKEDVTTTDTSDVSTTTSKDKPTTTTATKYVLPTSGDWEKPVTINTAVLYNKQTSSYDNQAETMRQSILNKKDTLKASGTTYYISYRGDDANDGLSPNTPWKSPSKAENKLMFKAGDAVLFERGGVYRDVSIVAAAGVSYGAYGDSSKPKPQLYGGDKNYADESLWEKTSTANVWKATVTQVTGPTAKDIEDIGNVIIDYGKICASDGKMFSVGKLAADYDFYYDKKSNALYLYLSKGNPGKLHTSIEIAPNEHIFQVGNAKNVTIENLCIKYTGAHGISCGATNGTTIRGCEIGYIGGGMLTSTARFGNGIEFFGAASNCTVENNWIYQCFDAGYTNQGPSDTGSNTGWHTNINIKSNLIEYCPYNIEVWTIKDSARGGLKNCTYSDNILRFAGYGFGTNNRIGSNTKLVGNVSFYDYVVPCVNTVIKNNVFDCSYRYVISIAYPNDAEGRGPTITDNTWIQKTFSNEDTTAMVGHTKLDGYKTYGCATLDEMKTNVAIFDKNPKNVILEN